MFNDAAAIFLTDQRVIVNRSSRAANSPMTASDTGSNATVGNYTTLLTRQRNSVGGCT
jgi:hypothetical protein